MFYGKKRVVVVLFISLILAYYQTIRIDAPNYELKLKRHTSVIDNSIEYPYKYRLLNPFITEIWIGILNQFISPKTAFLAGYLIQNVIVYGFMLFSVFSFFRLWFNHTGSLICLLYFSILIPLSLTGYDTLGDITTAGIMSLSFIFMNENKERYLYPLIFLGALNELQSILIVGFYFIAARADIRDKKKWMHSAGLLITFLMAYFIIFLLRGGEAGASDVKWYFTKDAEFNLAHKDWIILWAVMIVPLIIFAVRNFSVKPEFLKLAATIVLPLFYFLAFFFIARMREIDKALTIFIILIPLAFYTIFPMIFKGDTCLADDER